METKMIRYCKSELAKVIPCNIAWEKQDFNFETQRYVTHTCKDEPCENFCHNLINNKISNITVKNGEIKVDSIS